MNHNFQNFVQNIFKSSVNCWTHPNSKALTYCSECKVFLCEIENCGKNHIFHNIENLESLGRKKVAPLLQKFNENLEKLDKLQDSKTNKNKVKEFKNQIENFIQSEKSKFVKLIEEINISLNEIYKNYANEIQKIHSSVKSKLVELESSIQNDDSGRNPYELLNKIVNLTLAQKSRQKDYFIIQLLSNFNELNNIKFNINPMNQNKIIDIQNILDMMRQTCNKEFEAILEPKLINDIRIKSNEMINFFNKNIKKPKENIQIQNKINLNFRKEEDNSNKKLITSQISGKAKNVDLDILFRHFVSEFNQIRKNPNHLAKYKQESLNDNFNQELENLYKSIKNISNLLELEWDSDLAEAAEKYLMIYPNDHLENFNDLNAKMMEIIENIYPFQKVETYALVCLPDEIIFMCKLLINWKHYKNIFLGNFNLIGISGHQIGKDKVMFLINIAYFIN